MKKKIIIGIGAFVLIIIIGFIYLNYRNRSLSPPGIVKYDKNDLVIEIPYSRPSKRGRLIFGTQEQGALLPYGKYWRLGANEATEVTFNRDVIFNGQPVKAGTYRMYAVPGEDEFEISLNTGLGKWGYSEPDYSLDILKTKFGDSMGRFMYEMANGIDNRSITPYQDPKSIGREITFAKDIDSIEILRSTCFIILK